MKNAESTHYIKLSFHGNPESEAVMSVHGEVPQKSVLKQENVGDVSTPMLLYIKFLKIVETNCPF